MAVLKKSSVKKFIILASVLSTLHCTFQRDKTGSGEGGFGKAPLCEPISFAQVQAQIFGTPQDDVGKCLKCHIPGGRLLPLDSFSAVKARLAQIEDSVRSNRMPKNGPLSDDKKQLLYSWIQQGAPEVADANAVQDSCATNTDPTLPTDPTIPTDPVTPPVAVVLEPHYESLRAGLFAKQCLGCHDGSGIFSFRDFTTYESIISYQNLFAMPVDGSDSRFVHALVTGKMPKDGKPLTPEQIEVVRQWVALGLPEKASDVGGGIEPEPCLYDFSTVNKKVFAAVCTRCHDMTSKLDLQSFTNIKQHLTKIQWAVTNDKMPPKKPLDAPLKDMLLKWIDQGAPEFVDATKLCAEGEKP